MRPRVEDQSTDVGCQPSPYFLRPPLRRKVENLDPILHRHALGPARHERPVVAMSQPLRWTFDTYIAISQRIPAYHLIGSTDSVHYRYVRDWISRPASGAVVGALPREPIKDGFQLDELSGAIIEKLQQDGRRSYAGIGKAVGLSEAAVRQRVQRMVDAGVMQIVAVTDPMQLGFARQAMIGIRCTGDTTRVAEKLAAIESVDYVVLTAGSFDAIVEVVCEDDDSLLDLLNTQIRALPGVISTETLVYLKLVKQQYNWGTR